MDIRSIISKLEEAEHSPAVGDVVYLEFGNTLEVETTILEVNGGDIILQADDRLVGLLEQLNTIEENKIFEGSAAWLEKQKQVNEEHDKSHNGPYDRGAADSYYGRKPNPHKWVENADGTNTKVALTDPKEIAAYMAGYRENDDRKDYGEGIGEAGIIDKVKGMFGKKQAPAAPAAAAAPAPQAEKRPGNYGRELNGTKLVNLLGHKKAEDIGWRLGKKAASKVVAKFPDGNFYDMTYDQGIFRLAPSKQSEEGWYGYAVTQQGNVKVRGPSKEFNPETLGEGDVVAFKRPEIKGDAPNLGRAKELARELYWRETSSWNTPEELKAENELKNQLAKIGFTAETDLDADDTENMVLTHKASGKQYRIEGDDLHVEDAVSEAEYQGRSVPLGKPMRGDVKKFKVYVKDPSTGNVKKVNFGDKTMRIKKSNPKRRKSFRARHNCANPGPRTKARYWSCRKW